MVSYPIYRVVRILGFAVVALVLTWTVHYRGGLALISSNKDLIFNVIIILFFHLILHFVNFPVPSLINAIVALVF